MITYVDISPRRGSRHWIMNHCKRALCGHCHAEIQGGAVGEHEDCCDVCGVIVHTRCRFLLNIAQPKCTAVPKAVHPSLVWD